MKKQSNPMEIWNTVCDANVDLFHARMNFSAEMFDLYTKWPRKSFSDMTEAMKAAHLESLKLLAAKPVTKAKAAPKKAKVAAKAELKVVENAPKPAAKPAVKAGPKPVTLPDMPDFTAKPRPTPAEAPKPAETPEKDS